MHRLLFREQRTIPRLLPSHSGGQNLGTGDEPASQSFPFGGSQKQPYT